MKFSGALPLVLAALLMLAAAASAWGPKTREYFCRTAVTETWGEEAYARCFVSTRIEEMCSLVDGGYRDACLNLTSMPWDMPDVVFQDTEKHHDYSMCPIDTQAAGWLCGDRNSAPARDKAREWFTRARNLGAGCRSLYAFCVGADYHAKRFFRPNQVIQDDQACEDYLKGKVDGYVGSAEDWSVRTTCHYEQWTGAGQKRLVTENPVYVVNRNRMDAIVDDLVVEAERLARYQSGVQALADAVGIQSTTTSTTSSTTTLTQTTTSSITQTTSTSVAQTSSSTTVAQASTTTVQPAKAPETTSVKAQAETPKKAAGSAGVWIIGIVILLLAGAYAAVSSRARKQQPVTHEHAQEEPFQKTKKKRKESTLRDIKGLGKVAEDRLRSHGIDSLKKLLEADTGEIAEETGISEERIHAWKQKAEELIGV